MAKLARVATYLLVILLAIWSFFPIYTVLIFSVMTQVETLAMPTHFVPEDPTLIFYGRVLGLVGEEYTGVKMRYAVLFVNAFQNSIIVAGVTTLIAVTVGSVAGYAFARFSFRRKNTWLMSILVSRALPAASMAIPFFYMFTLARLVGTHVGLILTHMSFAIPLATWVLLGYFANLPLEVERAGRMDGLGRLSVLFRIVIPMAKGGVASVGILLFLLSWSEFFFALILTVGSPAETVPPVVSQLTSILVGIAHPSLLAASTCISLVPVIIMGVIFQRYILRLKIVDPVTVRAGEEIPFA